jgi:hypothetical protein
MLRGRLSYLSAVTGTAEARDRVIYVKIRCSYVLVLVNVNVPERVGFLFRVRLCWILPCVPRNA